MSSLGEAGISSEYDIDDVLLLLETVVVFLVVFVIFALFFLRGVCRSDLKDLRRNVHSHIEWLLLGWIGHLLL